EKFPTTAKVFLPDGRAPQAGELWKNPDLARTLLKTLEAEQNALKQKKSRADAIQAASDRFYKGDIAQEFDRFFKENHGALAAADLAAYKPQWTEPVHSTYRGYDVYSNPATSRGGIELLMQLNLVEGYDLAKLGVNSADALHLLIEAIKVAKADVYHYVADPKFTKAPVDALLSKNYADSRRKLIDLKKSIAYPEWGRPDGALAFFHPPAGPAFAEDYEMERDTTSFS